MCSFPAYCMRATIDLQGLILDGARRPLLLAAALLAALEMLCTGPEGAQEALHALLHGQQCFSSQKQPDGPISGGRPYACMMTSAGQPREQGANGLAA